MRCYSRAVLNAYPSLRPRYPARWEEPGHGRQGKLTACCLYVLCITHPPPSPVLTGEKNPRITPLLPPKPRAAHQPILVTPQKPAIAWQRMTDDASARIPSRASPSPTPLLTPHYSGVVCNIVAQTAYAETHITHPPSPSSGLQRDGVAVSE